VTLAFAVSLIGLGFAGAFLSGLVGVGGAIVMIPLLYYVPPLLGVGSLDIKQVAGVTMTQVLVSAALGAWTHGRRARVHRRLAMVAGGAMAAGALAGGVASSLVSGRALLVVFAGMTTAALVLMAARPALDDHVGTGREMPFDRFKAAIYPCGIGIASGLVGAGGAFLVVPVLVALLRIPVRLAIGTSLAIVGISAAAGFAGKALTAQIPIWPALAVVLGSIAGAPLGARMSHRAPVSALRAVLAGVVAAVAIRVWVDVLWP